MQVKRKGGLVLGRWLSPFPSWELPILGLSCGSGRVTSLLPGWNLASLGTTALGTFSHHKNPSFRQC